MQLITCLNFDHRCREALSAGGSVEMELQETFWASSFAAFSDRFGVPWMINCGKEAPDSGR